MRPTDKETIPAREKLAQFARAQKITDNALLDFARTVLFKLEYDKEWNADTLEAISFEARSRGLAIDDWKGDFKSIV